MVFRIARLKRAVERTHHCRASHIGSRIIVEPVPGHRVWRGRVEVFAITGHPQADRCYAWEDGTGPGVERFTRLRIAPVTSAQTAVRGMLARRLIGDRVPAH